MPRVLLVSLLVILVVAVVGSVSVAVVEEEREQSSRPKGDYCMNVDGDLLRSLGMTEAVMQRGGWVSHQPPPLFGSLQGALSLSLSVSLSLCLCLSGFVCVDSSLSLCLCLSVCLSVCLCVRVFDLCLSQGRPAAKCGASTRATTLGSSPLS